MDKWKETFENAKPFEHIRIDNFLKVNSKDDTDNRGKDGHLYLGGYNLDGRVQKLLEHVQEGWVLG